MADVPFAPEIESSLLNWLSVWPPDQRWFADKAESIGSVTIADRAVVLETGANSHHLLLARYRFESGRESRYFVPATRSSQAVTWSDALGSPEFRRQLIEASLTDRSVRGLRGVFSFTSSAAMHSLAWPDRIESRVLQADQSNSSLVFSSLGIAKIFRRCALGINPEVSVGRYLTDRQDFHGVPRLLADMSYRDDQGDWTLGVLQEYVANSIDAWSLIQNELLTGQPSIDFRHLGGVIARMHLALAAPTWDHAFTSELVDADIVDTWTNAYRDSLLKSASQLASAAVTLDERTALLAETFAVAIPQLESKSQGFATLLGQSIQRVHGDLHLGQVLVGQGGDIKIVDFEGEPSRDLAERNAKSSPLKDVAGMLRSFSYARGYATQTNYSADQLVSWERSARAEFLDGYQSAMRTVAATSIPQSNDDFHRAVSAWEADKALYEIRYEIASRPDWLWLPLTAVLRNA